jgi:DNA-binding transcriptional ArsR family regulator
VADEQQELLDALSSPVRREILWLVWDRELPAGEIAAAFEVTAPTISQHLAVLRAAGLVDMRVDGSFRRYRARSDAFEGLESLLAHTGRPGRAPARPGPWHTTTSVARVARLHVEVPHPPDPVFACFVDPKRYSAWLGVPVTIADGRFSCTTESGLRIRGTYDVISPPELLAMQWTFQSDEIPIPTNSRRAYLWVRPTADGSRVEVEQLARDEDEARVLGGAWATVLDRFHEHVAAAVTP